MDRIGAISERLKKEYNAQEVIVFGTNHLCGKYSYF
jgi:hypothetical protein